MRVLGIETSCDETAAAVVEDDTSTVVAAGFGAEMHPLGYIILNRRQAT